jgi:hypothetical protein
MQTATAASVILLTAIACSSAHAVQVVAHGTSQTTGASQTAGTLALAAPPALPPPLEAPRELACTLVASSWPVDRPECGYEEHHFLRFHPGGQPFAEVFGGKDVKLALPVALASAGGMLTLDAQGVVVQGSLEAAEMPLYPASAFVMSGVFVPNGERRLVWRSAKPGLITVATEAVPRLRVSNGELVAERECKDISFGTVVIDDNAIDRAMHAKIVPVPVGPARPWPWLRPGKLTFTATSEGDALAELDVVEPRDDSLTIQSPRVLAVAKGQTRIALKTFGGVLFGWVPSTQLVTSTLMYTDLSHDCFDHVSHVPKPSVGRVVACARDVALVAEAAGERRLVGLIRAGAQIKPLRTLTGWSEVEVEAGVVAADGASFWARESELASCPPLL